MHHFGAPSDHNGIGFLLLWQQTTRTQVSYLRVLEVRSPKQGLPQGRAALLQEALGEIPFPCLFL